MLQLPNPMGVHAKSIWLHIMEVGVRGGGGTLAARSHTANGMLKFLRAEAGAPGKSSPLSRCNPSLRGAIGWPTGATWDAMGATWDAVGATWGAVGAMWGAVGATWDAVGATWDAVGATWGAVGATWRAVGAT